MRRTCAILVIIEMAAPDMPGSARTTTKASTPKASVVFATTGPTTSQVAKGAEAENPQRNKVYNGKFV